MCKLSLSKTCQRIQIWLQVAKHSAFVGGMFNSQLEASQSSTPNPFLQKEMFSHCAYPIPIHPPNMLLCFLNIVAGGQAQRFCGRHVQQPAGGKPL
jgi:hypothetical protein